MFLLHNKKLFFVLLLFSIPLFCMEDYQTVEPAAKRERLNPKYSAIPDEKYAPLNIIKEIIRKEYINCIVKSPRVAYPMSVIWKKCSLYIYDAVGPRLVSKRSVNPKEVGESIEKSILIASFFESGNSNVVIDMRSEKFSGLVERGLLSMDKQVRFSRDCRSALRKIRLLIVRLPFDQMKLLIVWGMRNKIAGADDLFPIVYSYLTNSNETFGHIAYPQSWLNFYW